MVDIIDRQEPLVVVGFYPVTVFRVPVGEDAQYRQIVRLVEGQYPVIQQISCRDRCFGRMQLALCDLGIGIDIGQLVNATYVLERDVVKCVLACLIKDLITRIAEVDVYYMLHP